MNLLQAAIGVFLIFVGALNTAKGIREGHWQAPVGAALFGTGVVFILLSLDVI